MLFTILGVVLSDFSLYLRFGRRVLLQALKTDHNAVVHMPLVEVVLAFKASLAAN